MASGVELEKMRRRVRLSRLALFSAIAAGPVALGVAVMSGPSTVAAAPSAAKPTAMRTMAVGADPGGFAQLFVGAWLRSSSDDVEGAQARLARSVAPDVDLPAPASGAQSKLVSVTAVRSMQRTAGQWWVTVAAQYADGLVRFYAVPVAADQLGGSFTVTGAPGAVASPARAEVPKSSYGVSVPDGDLSSTVGQFLAAYLTGAGDVDRYLAPGVKLSAVSPVPYTAVVLEQVSAIEEAAAAGQVPAEGTQVRVLASVEARDANGRWPLTYEFTFKARSGRWEVSALESGAAQDGGAR